jgi:ribonuclease P protein component
MAGPGLRLSQQQRLKNGRDFLRVKTQGRRIIEGCLIMNWLALPSGETTRLGVITSKRLGNAVTRNRARRLLREAFRRHQHDLTCPSDVVLVARSSIVDKGGLDVERDYLKALRKARLLPSETHSSPAPPAS